MTKDQIADNGTIEKQDAIVKIESEKSIQEIQAQIIVARKFPRDVFNSRDRILTECKRKKFADIALYKYPRGKDDKGNANIITGETIRMAEMYARNWTNLKSGIKELSQGEDYSEIGAYAWDLETNVVETREFRVPHYRKARGEVYLITDPRDVYELVANYGARRRRACILALIPKDVRDEAIETVQAVVVGELSGENRDDHIRRMLDEFKKHQVSQEMIEAKIGCKVKDISNDHALDLKMIFNALEEGQKRGDYFDVEKETSDATKTVEEKIKERNHSKPDPE